MTTKLFTQTQLDSLCNEVLTQIEIEESRLLNWGFIEVRSNLDADLPKLLDRLPPPAREQWLSAQAAGVTLEQIISNLLDRKLILKSRGRYRSRFAEAIRLLYLLRQRFSDDDWQSAPRLVSDMRIQLQRRRYPKRDIRADQLLDELADHGVGPIHLEMVRALLRIEDDKYLDLALFQKEAVVHQFRSLRHAGDRGLVIGAGTGAGKTKAFYIPALAEVAASLTQDRWVRVIAIYPRVELLKDQLAEAYLEARKLDSRLRDRRQRMITLAAYYGDTPVSAQYFLRYSSQSWERKSGVDGWICPFFFCPNPRCSERDMVWFRDDVEQEIEANKRNEFGRFARLRCPSCHTEVSADQLLLTREQMVRTPPDVLFTTTEMLNRRLSRTREHPLFGLGTKAPPRMVLLDEIHTYEGLTGAQVAHLLRRWRHMRGYRMPTHAPSAGNLCIVGLSATLSQAEEFFSKLTGLAAYQIAYIAPRDEDLVEEGVEYNVVLKGDPVSGTALLSTSVQTAMLIGRILDPHSPGSAGSTEGVSRGAYGHKIFAFTDKLDVINRWFHIERDAEERQNLASLRKPDPTLDHDTRQRRYQMGQDWLVAPYIGHDLDKPLRLDITSSQNRGVRSAADLVIATSTLEVGYNDPAVGAVIQHKSPRSLASFLQRKGRAGRTRRMRPWMAVVTSAYGRDRWAFQHAETLFSPVLPPIHLPLDNYYVRKIQAAYALMDWLAVTMKRDGLEVDVWELLSSDDRGNEYLARQRERACHLLIGLLTGERLQEFTSYLRRALGLNAAGANDERDLLITSLLWGEPRSLLFEVVPTLVRQLESSWQRVVHGQVHPWSDSISSNPMPDFVPPSLFTELTVPELVVHLPELPARAQRASGAVQSNGQRGRANLGTRRDETQDATPQDTGRPHEMRRDEMMELSQGMREFAPGHVSKRFSRSHYTTEAHWLALPDDAQLSRGALPLQYLKIEKEDVPKIVSVDSMEYHVYRPRAYTLDLVPLEVKSTSSARLFWRSHFEPRSRSNVNVRPEQISVVESDNPTAYGNHPSEEPSSTDQLGASRLDLPGSSPWDPFFPAIWSYTHANGCWVNITRLATKVRVETRFERSRKPEVRRTLSFEEEGRPAALGFTISADALEFKFAPLDAQKLMANTAWPRLYQAFGPQYFLNKLQTDLRVTEAQLSSFDIHWLWQLELSMLVAMAVAKRCTLTEAAQDVARNRTALAERTLRVIFQTQRWKEDDQGEEGNDDTVEGGAGGEGRLHKRLMGHIANPSLVQAIEDCERVLWERNDPGLPAWLGECYVSSLGAAVLDTVGQLVPDINTEELMLDVEGDSIWISEASAGGVGLVSQIASVIAQRPRDFDLQMLDTIQHCDREQLAVQLRSVAEKVDQGEPPLLQAFASVRAEADLPRQEEVRRALANTLEEFGVPATRELIVSLNAKFLRPNSAADSDELIAALARHWEEEQERIGCTIDLRVMAVAAPRIEEIAEKVHSVLRRIGGPNANIDESQVFNLLQSLLWLPCVDSCPDCIETTQPFQELVRPSRPLLLAMLDLSSDPIQYPAPDWEVAVLSALSSGYYAQVGCEQGRLDDCKRDILNLLTMPVEIGFQLFYPVVERISRSGRQWLLDLVIKDLVRS